MALGGLHIDVFDLIAISVYNGDVEAEGDPAPVAAFNFTNPYVMLQPEVIVARAHEKFDADGRLTDDSTRRFLGHYLETFRHWVDQRGGGGRLAEMHVTRIFADADGETHFARLDVALVDAGTIGQLSERLPATGVIFRVTPPEYDFDWHPAPQRQYIVLLDGEIEITVGDGETRRFRGGDVLLVEDTEGREHRTRTVDGRPRRSIFITL